MNSYLIYRTTTRINNKYYIGKHTTDGYLGSGLALGRAIRKHGIENFAKEILFVFDTADGMGSKERDLANKGRKREPDGFILGRKLHDDN